MNGIETFTQGAVSVVVRTTNLPEDRMNKEVQKALIEIFKSVADLCDSGCNSEDLEDLNKVYNEQMPVLQELYQELIDTNPFNNLI